MAAIDGDKLVYMTSPTLPLLFLTLPPSLPTLSLPSLYACTIHSHRVHDDIHDVVFQCRGHPQIAAVVQVCCTRDINKQAVTAPSASKLKSCNTTGATH